MQGRDGACMFCFNILFNIHSSFKLVSMGGQESRLEIFLG